MATVMCIAQKAPVNWVRLSQPFPWVIGAIIGLPVALLIVWLSLTLFTPGPDDVAQEAKTSAIPVTTEAATAGAQKDVYLPAKGAGCKW